LQQGASVRPSSVLPEPVARLSGDCFAQLDVILAFTLVQALACSGCIPHMDSTFFARSWADHILIENAADFPSVKAVSGPSFGFFFFSKGDWLSCTLHELMFVRYTRSRHSSQIKTEGRQISLGALLLALAQKGAIQQLALSSPSQLYRSF